MEEALLGTIKQVEIVDIEEQIEKIRKKAESKITAITNKATSSYYKDNDSIATMEDLQSKLLPNLTTTSQTKSY